MEYRTSETPDLKTTINLPPEARRKADSLAEALTKKYGIKVTRTKAIELMIMDSTLLEKVIEESKDTKVAA